MYVREAHLVASDGAPGDGFAPVSLVGNRLAVGANQGQFSGRGAAYLFERLGSIWTEVAKLTASDGADHDGFGFPLALQDDFVVIGANQDANNAPGKAYVFAVDGEDCNHNGVLDWCDIAGGASDDDNHDGVADECEVLVGDLNCDGHLDFGDINPFVLALTNWGRYLRLYPDCDIYLADINGDGYVDFDDVNPFVALLSQ
jgi:hypothetical protein